jgi:transposase
MEIKNKYYKHSRLSENRFRDLMRCFALDLSATETAAQTGISCRAVNTIYLKLRHRIAFYCEQASNPNVGSVESEQQALFDELGRRIAEVFGVRTVDGKVSCGIIPGLSKVRLKAAAQNGGDATASCPSSCDGYEVLSDFGFKTTFRPRASTPQSGATTDGRDPTRAFLDFAKQRLQKFNGVPAHTFYLHLKESEFRFNLNGADLAHILLRMLRDAPLELSLNQPVSNAPSNQPDERLAA